MSCVLGALRCFLLVQRGRWILIEGCNWQMGKRNKPSKTADEPKPQETYRVLNKNRGFIKVQYKPNSKGDVFSLVYGCPIKFSQDNGRVLGYDTQHAHDPVEYGPCHRHYLARKEAFSPSQYEEVYEIFSAQWPAIVQHYSQNDTLDNFQLPG